MRPGDMVRMTSDPPRHAGTEIYLVPPVEFATTVSCKKCIKPECLEWSALQRLDAARQPMPHWIFNICECNMFIAEEPAAAEKNQYLHVFLQRAWSSVPLGTLSVPSGAGQATLAAIDSEPGMASLPGHDSVLITDGVNTTKLQDVRAPFVLKRYFDHREVAAVVQSLLACVSGAGACS